MTSTKSANPAAAMGSAGPNPLFSRRRQGRANSAGASEGLRPLPCRPASRHRARLSHLDREPIGGVGQGSPAMTLPRDDCSASLKWNIHRGQCIATEVAPHTGATGLAAETNRVGLQPTASRSWTWRSSRSHPGARCRRSRRTLPGQGVLST